MIRDIHDFSSPHFDVEQYIAHLGTLKDEDIFPAYGALALSCLTHDGLSPARYAHHLQSLEREVAAAYKGKADIEAQHLALKSVLCDECKYRVDDENPEDLQNASMMRVIDRGRGLPIALAILYIHAGRAQGWDVVAVNFPGHILCRIHHEGQRILFDPRSDCQIMTAPDLRRLLKATLGDEAELSVDYYDALDNRDVLHRLQNIIKFRQIALEDYEGALETALNMHIIDPQEYRLMLDLGVLYMRVDRLDAARDMLLRYIECAPHSRDRQEAELLLEQMHLQGD